MINHDYPQDIHVLYYGRQSIKIDGKKVIRHIFALPDSDDENAHIHRLYVLIEQAKYPVMKQDIWLIDFYNKDDLIPLIAEEFPGVEKVNLTIPRRIY